MISNRKVAVVTGAGTRVGAAIAERLAQAGYSVAVHYFSSRSGAAEVQHKCHCHGVDAQTFAADLSQPTACEHLIQSVISEMGRIDLLVGSAANFERVPLRRLSLPHWQSALDLNVRANAWLSKAAFPTLKRHKGSIVFITCNSIHSPYRDYLPYQVSKGAALQLSKVLAVEFAPHVRVNAVSPGTVLVPKGTSKTQQRKLKKQALLDRVGTPTDVADAVAYFAQASFVTGVELIVDGGAHLSAQAQK